MSLQAIHAVIACVTFIYFRDGSQFTFACGTYTMYDIWPCMILMHSVKNAKYVHHTRV